MTRHFTNKIFLKISLNINITDKIKRKLKINRNLNYYLKFRIYNIIKKTKKKNTTIMYL